MERRRVLLRARKDAVVDPDVRYQESAVRARVARQVRVSLRQQRPVFLLTPRWSRPDRFLDELSADLSVDRPAVSSEVVPLAYVAGRSVSETHNFLLRCVVGSAPSFDGQAATQPLSADGFRRMLGEAFNASASGPRRALLMNGVEHLRIDVLRDLIQVLIMHHQQVGEQRRFNLLFAGTVDPGPAILPGVRRLALPDFGHAESVQSLMEYADAPSARDAALAATMVGGVPALVHGAGHAMSEAAGKIPIVPAALWKAMGPVHEEVKSAISIVAADEHLAERLEALVRGGAQPFEPTTDEALLRTGLVRSIGLGPNRRVTVRAPLIAQIAGRMLNQDTDEVERLEREHG
jgi:hypothetical protein